MKNQKRKGFTLVELIIVVVIIGILIGIGTMLYSKVTTDAAANTALSNLKTMESAIVVYQTEHSGAFPAAADDATAAPNFTGGKNIVTLVSEDCWKKPADFTYTYTLSTDGNTATIKVTAPTGATPFEGDKATAELVLKKN